jgi:hypothetical protein
MRSDSNYEEVLVRKLQQEDQVWRWLRFVMIALGVVITVFASYSRRQLAKNLVEIAESAKQQPNVAIMLAAVNTDAAGEHLIAAAGGVMFVMWGLARWNGDPVARLLLTMHEQRRTDASLGEETEDS